MKMQLLLSRNAIAVYEILIIIGLVFALIYLTKKNRESRERRQIRNEKMRNQQLEEILKNPDITGEHYAKPNPFDVQYLHAAREKRDAKPGVQAEIEVHTETSVQRFLFDLEQELTIGQDETNVLPLNDRQAAKKNCSVFVKNQEVYLKNLSTSHPVWIQRGRNRQLIQNQIVKLQSKDILTVGRTVLYISLYEG